MKVRHGLPLALVLLALPVLSSGADPAAAIKYRQNTMRAQGAHLANLMALSKGDFANKGHVTAHAQSLELTVKTAADVFPPESKTGETDALPAIWDKPAEFNQAYQALATAVPKLTAAAKSDKPDALGPALAEVGKACKNCHDNFRKTKQ
ncbi:MAG: cytochrome c [Deltaproteobacteria bacterium]|nr:cytochrome c [Deltaproteobacteria bacterium]